MAVAAGEPDAAVRQHRGAPNAGRGPGARFCKGEAALTGVGGLPGFGAQEYAASGGARDAAETRGGGRYSRCCRISGRPEQSATAPYCLQRKRASRGSCSSGLISEFIGRLSGGGMRCRRLGDSPAVACCYSCHVRTCAAGAVSASGPTAALAAAEKRMQEGSTGQQSLGWQASRAAGGHASGGIALPAEFQPWSLTRPWVARQQRRLLKSSRLDRQCRRRRRGTRSGRSRGIGTSLRTAGFRAESCSGTSI